MTKRNLNADLIRCVAVFSVISVHFLLNGGFLQAGGVRHTDARDVHVPVFFL